MEKIYLDIENAIIIHDVKQIKKEPAQKKIKTKNQLAKKIHKLKLIEGSEESIYTKIWRSETEGYKQEPKELITALLKVLEVDMNELVKK
jgi:hypothetical protein